MIEPVPITSSKPSRSAIACGVEAVAGGRHDHAAAFGLVAGDRLRARPGGCCAATVRVGEAVDQRLQDRAGGSLRPSSRRWLISFSCAAVDQLQQHRPSIEADHERQEQQPPRRPPQRAMEQERRVGRAARDRPVHVVDGEVASCRARRGSRRPAHGRRGLSTSTAASGSAQLDRADVEAELAAEAASASGRASRSRSTAPRNPAGPSASSSRQPFLRSCSTARHSSIAGRAFGRAEQRTGWRRCRRPPRKLQPGALRLRQARRAAARARPRRWRRRRRRRFGEEIVDHRRRRAGHGRRSSPAAARRVAGSAQIACERRGDGLVRTARP